MLPAHQRFEVRLMAVSRSAPAVRVSAMAAIVTMSSLSRLLDPGIVIVGQNSLLQRASFSRGMAISYLPEPSLDTFCFGATPSTIFPVLHPARQSLGKWDCHLGISETMKTVLSSRSPDFGAINQSAYMRSNGFLRRFTFSVALKFRRVLLDILAIFASFMSPRHVGRCDRELYGAHQQILEDHTTVSLVRSSSIWTSCLWRPSIGDRGSPEVALGDTVCTVGGNRTLRSAYRLHIQTYIRRWGYSHPGAF